MSEWLRERTLALIEAFHRNECLWKSTSQDYTNRPVKNAAWEDVAKAASCDVRSAEKKMKSLRTQFMCIYKETTRNAGSGREGVFQPKWFAFNALKFLVEERYSMAKRNARVGRKGPLYEERISREDHRLGQCGSIVDSETSGSWTNAEIFTTPNSSNRGHGFSTNRTTISPMSQKRNGDELDGTNEKGYSSMNVGPEHSGRDEFIVFAEHIAHRLRKISDPQARLIAQHQINNVLFEAEMTKFHSNVLRCNAATNTEPIHVSQASPRAHNSSYYNHLETSGCENNVIIIEDEDCDVKEFV